MNNVLLDPLPTEWNGYPINYWFQIGIQIYLVFEDDELVDFEKADVIANLLFPGEVPPKEQVQECLEWFLNGWCHDRSPKERDKRRLMDFNNDQWRIYADFRQIYGINLNEADLHWWEFMGMLWNMPQRQSSFLQVVDIRRKKLKSKMSKEERESIRNAQYIYGLEEKKEKKRVYTDAEKQKIDEVDALREKMKRKKEETDEALDFFREG